MGLKVVVPGHHDGVISASLPRGVKGTQVGWNVGFALHRLVESLFFLFFFFFFNIFFSIMVYHRTLNIVSCAIQ